jgi:hypothetical protein
MNPGFTPTRLFGMRKPPFSCGRALLWVENRLGKRVVVPMFAGRYTYLEFRLNRQKMMVCVKCVTNLELNV